MELFYVAWALLALLATIPVFVVLSAVWALQLLWPILASLAAGLVLRRFLGTKVFRQGDVIRSGFQGDGPAQWTLRSAPLTKLEELWNAVVESIRETTKSFCLGLAALGLVVMLLNLMPANNGMVLFAERSTMQLREALGGVGITALALLYLGAFAVGILRPFLRFKRMLDKGITALVAITSFTLFSATAAPLDATAQAIAVRADLEQPDVANRVDLFAEEVLENWLRHSTAATRQVLREEVVERSSRWSRPSRSVLRQLVEAVDIPQPRKREGAEGQPSAAARPDSPVGKSGVSEALADLLAEAIGLPEGRLHQVAAEVLTEVKSMLVERIIDRWSRSLRGAALALVLEASPITADLAPEARGHSSPSVASKEHVRFSSANGPWARTKGIGSWIIEIVGRPAPRPG